MRFNLKKTRTVASASVDVPEVGPSARLTGRLATEANKPYFNAMLKMGGKRLRNGKIDADAIAKNRGDDAVLYAKYVVSSWDGIVDEEGKPVKFTAEAAEEFFKQLVSEAPWVFDRVRNFFATPENFLEEDEIPPSAEVVAGN